MKNSSKKKNERSRKAASDASPEPSQVKLREHTAFKSSANGEKKNRIPVWVKEKTLDYERQLHDLVAQDLLAP